MIARAPMTKPPTGEKGRQTAAESRTIRPQTNTGSGRRPSGGTTSHQATPNIAMTTNCQMQKATNPLPPTDRMAWATRSKPYQPTSTVAPMTPSSARARESSFKFFIGWTGIP